MRDDFERYRERSRQIVLNCNILNESYFIWLYRHIYFRLRSYRRRTFASTTSIIETAMCQERSTTMLPKRPTAAEYILFQTHLQFCIIFLISVFCYHLYFLYQYAYHMRANRRYSSSPTQSPPLMSPSST